MYKFSAMDRIASHQYRICLFRSHKPTAEHQRIHNSLAVSAYIKIPVPIK